MTNTKQILAGLLLFAVALSTFGQTDAKLVVPPSLLPELLALNGDLETAQKPKYLSPSALVASPDKKYVYIAEQTAKQVAKLDCATNTVIQLVQMPNEPTGIAISKDGATLYVTCSSERWPNGFVCVVSVTTGKVTKRIAAGFMARSPVLSPDGATLYVCNWLNNDVSVINLASGTETGRIAVTREPYAAAITPDGTTLAVTNSLPDQRATDTNTISGKVSLISTATNTVRAAVPIYPVGTHSLFGIFITPDGRYVLATHLVGRFTLPATTLTNGWVHSNNLAIIDIAAGKLVNDVELDNSTQGFANPWGLGCTGDGKYLCVLHAGSNTMTVIDLPQLLVKAQAGTDLSHNFSAIYSIKTSVALSTKGSRAIAVIDNKAYVAGFYSDSLQVISVTALTSTPPSSFYSLGPGSGKPMTSERQGEFNFTDASICFQKWQSCFSCHPFFRPDALNWILNGDNNTPKNVKSMIYSWWTPPTSWAGKRPSAGGADGSIRTGIATELLIQPSEAIALPMDTFFMRMKPMPSRFLVKGRLSPSAANGRMLFTSVGCVNCHPAPLYTDQKFHNAGVINPFDPNTQWDTPSLIEAWRTSPYSHLGLYDNIKDMILLRTHNLGASLLSAQDLNDLVEYVSSL